MNKLLKMLRRLFAAVMRVINKITRFVERYWQYILLALVVVAVLFPLAIPALLAALSAPAWLASAYATAVATIGGWGLYAQVAAAVGFSFLVVPDAVSTVVGKTVDGIVEVGGKIVEGVGELAGDLVQAGGNALFSGGVLHWLLIGGAVFMGYKLLKD